MLILNLGLVKPGARRRGNEDGYYFNRMGICLRLGRETTMMTYEEMRLMYEILKESKNEILKKCASIARTGIDPEFIAKEIEKLK